MINFEQNFFQKMPFSRKQQDRFIESAKKDLQIAQGFGVPEVVFKFSYDAFIKIGIVLIAHRGYRVRSAPGHHIKIIEKLSQILRDSDIEIYGNNARRLRNIDLYNGGIMVSERDSKEFLHFVQNVFKKAENFFNK